MEQILKKKDWLSNRNKLKNSYKKDETWTKVIKMFEERVNNYYFKPVEMVEIIGERDGEGFTIVTVLCALIEMFAAFKEGQIFRLGKAENSLPNYEYGSSRKLFVNFLLTEKIFENHFFSGLEKNKPFDAGRFYSDVRCGLMHEARTKNNWLINAKKREYSGLETQFLTENPTTGDISIDRVILNQVLKRYFVSYIAELLEDSEKGEKLRRLFGRKLDNLYDCQPDNFEWWTDK